MAQAGRKAQRACGTALMAAGLVVLACSVICMAVLSFMERAAMQPERNPQDETGEALDAAGEAEGSVALEDVDWSYWHKVNPDIVAWIRIPGTGIDLPVALPPDDDPAFYLTHDAYKRWNPCGCPYVDASCEGGIDARNVVIYGHNMGDDSMFGSLVSYLDPAWAQQHPVIELVAPEGARTLQFAGCQTVEGSAEAKRTSFADDGDFERYVRETAASCGTWNVAAGARQNRLYTLCTCSYITNPADERTLIYAFETGEGMETP